MPSWRADNIAYCANVHPGTSASSITSNIINISAEVRRALHLHHMQVGLWICEQALEEYQDTLALAELKSVLANEKLAVHSLNGFPQGDFHQTVVKHEVYHPRWSEKSRLHYTQKLAVFLAECLPDNVPEGTISTLPLAYRLNWNAQLHQQACQNLCEYIAFAKALFLETGKRIRLCLEMEPGCVLQNTLDIVRFFSVDLVECTPKYGVSENDIADYLGICFDVCHQAVMHENIVDSLAAIHTAGIIIGKVQISSALHVSINSTSLTALNVFAEPKYLHQSTALNREGKMLFFDDLIEALNHPDFQQAHSARIHFHLPIQASQVSDGRDVLPGLSTTQDTILQLLDALTVFDYKPDIEIETYTWQVLPEYQHKADRQTLINGLVAEHSWLVSEMKKRNLITLL